MRQIVLMAMVAIFAAVTACSTDTARPDTSTDYAIPPPKETGVLVDRQSSENLRETAAPDAKTPVELAYDDGSVEEHDSPWSNQPGGEIAVCFTAPDVSMALIKADYYVPTSGKPTTTFGVRLYEATVGNGPGQEIALSPKPTAAATSGNEWVSIDLSAHAVVLTSRDFCLSMEWLTAPGSNGSEAQFLGIDKSAPDSRTWWKTGPATWTRIANIGAPAGDRDAMIRASVR